ncbi:MAG: spermidine/putrescine ABC transporter substrate-binding protein [Candidatus Omnitrophica bacterium]|nr:spermidine/putrescine ABC transporter substrate-binding protein [Candidatus Omnitrophota bacterium]
MKASGICLIFIALSLNFTLQSTFAQEEGLSDTLNIFNWEEYIDPAVLKDFENEFKVKVNIETYKDEDAMISALQSDPGKYDIVVASDSAIRDLREMRLIVAIDTSNIPNLKNIEREYQNPPYDPENKFSIPYLWGTTGVAYNTEYIKEKVTGWHILWDPKLKGKIAMLNNMDEVIGAALISLGYSLTSTNPEELKQAKEKLLKQKELLAGYLDPIVIRNKLILGELWAAHIYSGEAFFAMEKNSALKYVIPEEGAFLWVDAFAIPRDAKHKYTAETFINYVLDAKVSAKIVNYLYYADCNFAARQYILKEILENEALYPPQEVLGNCEVMSLKGTEEELRQNQRIRNEIWSQLLN